MDGGWWIEDTKEVMEGVKHEIGVRAKKREGGKDDRRRRRMIDAEAG